MEHALKLSVLLVLPALCIANGGPVDGSNILATGGPAPLDVPDVHLVSEDLRFTLDGDWVDVEAVYTLRNEGPAASLDYAFPVEYAPVLWNPEEAAWVPSELPYFRMIRDGRALDVDVLEDPETFTVEVEELGETLEGTRRWYASTFDLGAGETSVLTVQYRFKAVFMDWLTSKSFHKSTSNRSFRYDLDPAGRWGDGTVGDFRCTLDLGSLLRDGGFAVTVPGGGGWISDSLYVISTTDLRLSGAPPVEVVWNSDVRTASEHILAHRIPTELIEGVTASSVLPDQGGCSYAADNLLDMDLSTAWAEGVAGPGVGEWVEVSLSGFNVMEIAIIGGYAKNGGSYAGNARPAGIAFEILTDPDLHAGDLSGTAVLEDLEWVETGPVGFSPLVQSVLFLGDAGMPIRTLRLRVEEVHPGSSWEDLCITELLLLGYPVGEPGIW